MLKFSPVDVKAPLVGFECDSVAHPAAEHHLRTIHEVEHHIFEGWLQGVPVDQVEVDALICAYLDPHISFDIIDKSS